MCFSAEASFIGAGALTIIGAATLKTSLRKQDKLWAAIPLLFAFQQFCEGIVWLDLRGSIPHSALTVLTKDLYLIFALALWPIWIPFAFLVSENESWRKNILKVFFLSGIILAAMNLNAYHIFSVSPSIKKYSINYYSEASLYNKLIYLFIVTFPPLISSLKYMKVFGFLILTSCVISEYFYMANFTSVWCFLAGITSASLFLIARSNAENPQALDQNKNLIHK